MRREIHEKRRVKGRQRERERENALNDCLLFASTLGPTHSGQEGYKVLVCGDINSLPCPVQGAGRDFASIRIIAPLSLRNVFLPSSHFAPFSSLITLRNCENCLYPPIG